MCGIAGYVGTQAGNRVSWLKQANNRLRHRGPDAEGSRHFAKCLLGHRRLRILDLSAVADQPLCNEDGTIWVIFNGEVYNFAELRRDLVARGHQFRSHADTEVIVHGYEQWGDDVVERLEGMFAFALWDEPSERLLLVRDRLGIKPLYHTSTDDGVFFASETAALPHGDALSESAVDGYLRLGWIPGPGTVYPEVNELAPGNRLIWESGQMKIERWWKVETDGEQTGSLEQLRDALSSAVRRQLVSDVPVGIFLSSGLDSAVIATLAADAVSGFASYTVTFDHPDDEGQGAAQLAAGLGIPHVKVPVEGHEIVDALPQIIAAMDQPTVDGVNTWVVSRAVRQAGAVVALSGVGGDELFAGYSTFRYVPQFAAIAESVRSPGRAALATSARLGLRSARTAHSKVRRAVEAVGAGGSREAYAAVRGTFSAGELAWLRGRDAGSGRPAAVHAGRTVAELELGNYLPHQLLRDSDAMSMAHSLEIRVPLLDERVVTAALSNHGGVGGLKGKVLLASAVDPSLLRIAQGKKRTFTLPFDSWLRRDLADWSRDALTRLAAADSGLREDRLLTLWARFQSGQASWRALWSLAVLGHWVASRTFSARLGR